MTERTRDAARKRAARAQATEVIIPPCEDIERRMRLEASDAAWLRWYFHQLFWYDFTGQQLAMIEAIASAIQHGGDQAIAASRGEGKSSIFRCLLLKYILTGRVKFVALFGATGPAAEDSLESVKLAIESNERLAADYPEVCVPVRALENVPQRAGAQRVTGSRHDSGEPFNAAASRFTWCGKQVVLPNVPGSPAAGAIFATRGLDAAVRGLNKRDRRPDVAGIDDPDTEQTAGSQIQAGKLEKRIDRAIAGLGGQQQAVARVMLTTLQNRTCVSFKYTDPQLKPSWKGKRYRFLITQPDKPELWDEYIYKRQQDQQAGDEFGRGAHAYYVANRDAMDAGAVVANEHRFNAQQLADGSQLELSALQRYYNEVARIGQDAVSTEYDNDPPEDENIEESGISANRIRTHLRGTPKTLIPDGANLLTAGIDVSKRSLHWVVTAWGEGATGTVIDYGVGEVHNSGDDPVGIERAILNALLTWRDETMATPYRNAAGGELRLSRVLVDSGWFDTAVHNFTRQHGGTIFRSSKGYGQSESMTPYKAPAANSSKVQVGNHWHLSLLEAKGVWLVGLDADYWKRWVHDRFLTPVVNEDGTPYRGSLGLYGADDRQHMAYSKHLTAEVDKEEFVAGKGMRRAWFKVNRNNHWFDATYMASAAAAMCGVDLLPVAPKVERQRPVEESFVSGRRMMQRRQISFRRGGSSNGTAS